MVSMKHGAVTLEPDFPMSFRVEKDGISFEFTATFEWWRLNSLPAGAFEVFGKQLPVLTAGTGGLRCAKAAAAEIGEAYLDVLGEACANASTLRDALNARQVDALTETAQASMTRSASRGA